MAIDGNVTSRLIVALDLSDVTLVGSDTGGGLSQLVADAYPDPGQRGRALTPSLGRRLAALFPNSTLIEGPEARTFASLDNPGAVIDAVESISASRSS